jgi:hypothetical protein
MSNNQRKQRIIGVIGGLVLALAVLTLLWAAGIVAISVPGRDPSPSSREPLEGYNLISEDAHVRSLTFRRAWFDVELRIRYGKDWFVVKKPGWGRSLLAEAMGLSRKKYGPGQLSGSCLILQTGKPLETLRWKMYLVLETPDGPHGRIGAASLRYADLEFARGRLEKATPAAGETKLRLLAFDPVDPDKKSIEVTLVCHPIDVTTVEAEESPQKKS